jgi:molecular chaperone Hsp33
MMLQLLPDSENDDVDGWTRISHLASTLKNDELLELDNETLLHRLYNEETIRVYPADPIRFSCSCSKDRVGQAILTIPKNELVELIEEQGKVSVDCQFCLQHYSFNRKQVDLLNSSNSQQ